jgi:hypothetical protein
MNRKLIKQSGRPEANILYPEGVEQFSVPVQDRRKLGAISGAFYG